MKIAMFADSKFITDRAGNHYSLANLRRAALHSIADRCQRLKVVCRIRRGNLERVPPDDVIRHANIEFLGVPYFRGILGSYLARRTILAQARRAMANADICVMRYGSNISCTAQPLARRMGTPCIGHVLGEFDLEIRANPAHIPIPGLRRLVARWQLARNRASFQRCDMHCGVTEGLAARYAPPGRKVHQLVDTCLSSESYFPPRRKPNPMLRAVWAGRLLEFKNAQAFLRAAARLRKEGIAIESVIVGDGPFRPQLQAIAAELGLADRTSFTGRIESRKELWEEYRRADIGFMLSLSEGLPLGAIELMATGLPLLAADLDYMKPVITDGIEGLLADPNNVDDITNKLRRLATDPEQRYQMGLAAYQRAQMWSAATQAQKLIDLAASLLEAGRG